MDRSKVWPEKSSRSCTSTDKQASGFLVDRCESVTSESCCSLSLPGHAQVRVGGAISQVDLRPDRGSPICARSRNKCPTSYGLAICRVHRVTCRLFFTASLARTVHYPRSPPPLSPRFQHLPKTVDSLLCIDSLLLNAVCLRWIASPASFRTRTRTSPAGCSPTRRRSSRVLCNNCSSRTESLGASTAK